MTSPWKEMLTQWSLATRNLNLYTEIMSDTNQHPDSQPAILEEITQPPTFKDIGPGSIPPAFPPVENAADFVAFDERFNYQAEVALAVKAGATASRALNRAAYLYNSVHNADQPFTLQVSNHYAPTDSQWEDIETGTFVHTFFPFKWMRIKLAAAATADTLFYVQSIEA